MPALDLDLIHKSDTKKAKEAAKRLLDSGELTEIQRRRFILHFAEGLSYRQIASRERVHFTSVHESIEAAVTKQKKFSMLLQTHVERFLVYVKRKGNTKHINCVGCSFLLDANY